jgi:hypothetical protein
VSNEDFSDCASSSTGLGGPGACPHASGDGDRGSRGGLSAPAASFCDYCGGVFSRNPWALDRSKRCKTCGAGKHWECQRHTSVFERTTGDGKPQKCWFIRPVHPRSEWIVREQEAEIGPEEIAEWVARGEGIMDPLDRSFISADDLLGHKNYGRSKTDSPHWREHGEKENRIKAAFPNGGWGMARGSRRRPAHRPARGIQDAYRITTEAVEVLNEWEKRLLAGLALDGPEFVRHAKETLYLLAASLPTVNTQALAETWGISRATAYRWIDRGKDALSVIEHIDRRHEELLAAMRAEHEELLRIAFAFRYGETPVEAWERVLAEGETELT